MPTPNDLAKGIMTPDEARKLMGVPDKVKTKSMATIEQVEDDTQYGPNGGFTAVLSSPRLDRDGDMWPQNEWITPLPSRITIDADHGMSVATTVGSAVPYFDNLGRLLITASFSSIPRAQEVRTLIREGHVSSVSVAALTDNSKKSGTQKRELLNAGVVAIPANPDAVILDSKSEKSGGVTVKVTPVLDTEALDRVVATIKAATPGGGSDHALLQAIHDASVHLGANCAECMQCAAQALADSDPTGTSDGANVKGISGDLVDTDITEDEKSFTLEEFKAAMQEVLNPPSVEISAEEETPTETPEETPEAPVEEAAAATEEVPAPAEEAAAEVVEPVAEVDPGNRADHMLMALYAAQYN
jgi:hypothetical protein